MFDLACVNAVECNRLTDVNVVYPLVIPKVVLCLSEVADGHLPLVWSRSKPST